jgi:hypothetical protein
VVDVCLGQVRLLWVSLTERAAYSDITPCKQMMFFRSFTALSELASSSALVADGESTRYWVVKREGTMSRGSAEGTRIPA